MFFLHGIELQLASKRVFRLSPVRPVGLALAARSGRVVYFSLRFCAAAHIFNAERGCNEKNGCVLFFLHFVSLLTDGSVLGLWVGRYVP